MAAYREHITVSGLLGIGYGAAAALSMGFTPIQGCIAACFTWVAGMLPDLDAANGRPVREIFGLVAAIVPLTLEHQLVRWGGSVEGAIFVGLLLYAAIRYGAAAILSRVSVHRGMFHSLPVAILSAELVFLGFPGDTQAVRLMMATGTLIGFLSHLVLDETYSVQFSGVRLRLNKAAGSAFKLFGKNGAANVLVYGLLLCTTWFVLRDTGWVERLPGPPTGLLRQASEPEPQRL
jgi:membrane-bound metal-dependent hydrolase YbcI (DUF457 family)